MILATQHAGDSGLPPLKRYSLQQKKKYFTYKFYTERILRIYASIAASNPAPTQAPTLAPSQIKSTMSEQG